MRGWRREAMILALLAFAMAAVRSGGSGAAGPAAWLFAGWISQIGTMAFFWTGVVMFLVSVWGRDST
jgi:hypothetical protein